MMVLAQLRSTLTYQAGLLGVAALVTSLALAVVAKATAPDIAAAEARDLKESLIQVLSGDYDNDLTRDILTLPGPGGTDLTVYRARQHGRVQAVVFKVIGTGYAGPIISVLGLDRTGKILGVRVIKHAETPGLGDKVDAAKSSWTQAFAQKYLGSPAPEQWAVRKDGGVFDQFTGATITPRGVVKSVKGGLEFFEREKTRLLDDPIIPPVARDQ